MPVSTLLLNALLFALFLAQYKYSLALELLYLRYLALCLLY